MTLGSPDTHEASLRQASLWALLTHPFHDTALGVPYDDAIEAEIRRRGVLPPLRWLADAFLRVFLLPIRIDFTAWPEPFPPGWSDVVFCIASWWLIVGTLGSVAFLIVAAAEGIPRGALAGLLILAVSAAPLFILIVSRLLYFRFSQRGRRQRAA